MNTRTCYGLSEIETGRGLAFCMLLNVKLQRLCISYYLQWTISAKHSENNLEKSLCAQDRVKNQCCICDLWTLRQHCIKNRNSVMEIAAWAQERSVCEHQQMLRRSSEDMIQKGSHLLQPNAHLIWNEAKWKCVLCQMWCEFPFKKYGWRGTIRLVISVSDGMGVH